LVNKINSLIKKDLQTLTVKKFMTKKLTLASIDQPILGLIDLMDSKHIRHMPVSDKGKIVGILSLRDLMAFSHKELLKEVKEKNKLLKSLEKANEKIKSSQCQLAHASKLAAMGEMGAGVAHELNQPLMAISTHLETVLLNQTISSDEKLLQKLSKVKDQFSRLKTIVQRLSNHSKARDEQVHLADINAPIQDSLFLFQQQLKDHNIDLILELNEDLPLIYIDRFQIQDIVINFLVNARDAIDEVYHHEPGGKIKLFSNLLKNLKCIAIGVIDNGTSIDVKTAKKIFRPFFYH